MLTGGRPRDPETKYTHNCAEKEETAEKNTCSCNTEPNYLMYGPLQALN